MDAYATIALIANDPDFAERLRAAAAQEEAGDHPDPSPWVFENRYTIAAAPSWAEKVDYWMANNPDGGNGWATDPAVITDGDILARIQQMLTP